MSGSYVLELKLNTKKQSDRNYLENYFRDAWNYSNTLTHFAMRQLNRLKRDSAYCSLLRDYNSSSGDTKKRISRDLHTVVESYGLTKYGLQPMLLKKRKNSRYLHSDVAQKLSDAVWRGVEKCLYREGRCLHFNPYDEFLSFENKKNTTGIIYDGGRVYINCTPKHPGGGMHEGDCMNREGINRSSFKHNFLKEVIIRLDFQGVLPGEMDKILIEVKPYLKKRGFNRYEQQISNEIDLNMNSNGIFETANPVREIRNITVHSFINVDSGYTVDLSVNHICIKVNTTKYIPFDEYAITFMGVSNIYKSTIDFFTVKRFGLRKINFCFVNSVSCINKYFNQRYFDCYDLFEPSEVFASEKKENFSVDHCKINLLCDIEQGQLNDKQSYKLTLDSDIYIDDTDNIEKDIFDNEGISLLNERLFMIFVDAITDEFGKMLLSDNDINQDEIMGVERNE